MTSSQIFLSFFIGLLTAAMAGTVSYLWRRHQQSVFTTTGSLRFRDTFRHRSGFLIALIGLVFGFAAWGFIASVGDTGGGNNAASIPPSSAHGGVVVQIPDPQPTTTFSPAEWGPSRDTVSSLSRNSVVTINAMLDNPVRGDERNFAQVRGLDEANSEYGDQMIVRPGLVYVGVFHFANDASPDSPGSIANDTHIRIQMPGVATGAAGARGIISSSNAAPSEVWDGFTVLFDSPADQYALRYVQGSATIHSGGPVNGTPLSDDIFVGGVLLGCDALDGKLGPAPECEGFVTFRFRVDQPDFDVIVEARQKGTDAAYMDNVEVSAGDVVQVRVTYQNQGTTQQDKVGLRVRLPEGFRYVRESSEIANETTGGKYRKTIDGIATTGYNIGSYQPRGNAFFKFDVMVDDPGKAPFVGPWLTVDDFATAATTGETKGVPLTFISVR
ncbi:hypothetical protein [Cryobacterium ruanii]|uniref:DUF11 domain-containing protein n=1 Tax=Cryobacterium ruanii TaxID=1259197 RepID=A0A4R9AMR1_9MICO|nr:hypothetical protein [Cryobacterium ruanii]TFD66299.1 hypothetical protein E3T47_07250 [Cryobacterium ruanii]